MKRIKNTSLHFLLWAGYFFTIILGAEGLDENFWINFISVNLPLVILFYGNTGFIFPRLLQKQKYVAFALSLLLFISFVVTLRFLLAMLILDGTIADLLDSNNRPRIWSQIRFSLLFTGISFAVWYAKRNMEMSHKQQQLQKEIADAQLLSLKNQINPHFLYNTLSFLYTKSLPLSKDLSDAIAKLSEMMRYSLGEADANGKVPLESEVNHLKNFIYIHQMRYGNALHVNFEADGDIGHHKIVPLLLITFVENAFKHGKVSDKESPLNVYLHANKKLVSFSVSNKKSNGAKEKSSGIGLQNIKNRLELAYAGKHHLQVTNTNDYYLVNLTIEN